MPSIRTLRASNQLAGFLLVFIVAASLYFFFAAYRSGLLAHLSFDYSTIYSVRARAQSLFSVPLAGYLINWQAKVINIALLLYGLCRRKISVIIFALILQCITFGLLNHKSMIILPFAAFATVLFYHRRRWAYALFAGNFLLLVVLYIGYIYLDSNVIASLGIRRAFFSSIHGQSLYFNFFSNDGNDLILLSDSIFSMFIEYPYQTYHPKLLSYLVLGHGGSWNAGFYGDAYANFGLAGPILFSMFLTLWLRFLDSVSKGLPNQYAAALVVAPALNLVNSAFFATLLTHGFLLAAVVLWLGRGRISLAEPSRYKLSYKGIIKGAASA
jgi:hypothetical protein